MNKEKIIEEVRKEFGATEANYLEEQQETERIVNWLGNTLSEYKESIIAEFKRIDMVEILNDYSSFLEKTGYMDCDWYVEEPHAVDRYLEEKNKSPLNK